MPRSGTLYSHYLTNVNVHICVVINAAQKNFLNSTRPQMALDMRAALFQFDQALKLAENLDPARIPQLSYDRA